MRRRGGELEAKLAHVAPGEPGNVIGMPPRCGLRDCDRPILDGQISVRDGTRLFHSACYERWLKTVVPVDPNGNLTGITATGPTWNHGDGYNGADDNEPSAS